MTDAYRWQIKEEIIRRLREDVVFRQQEGDRVGQIDAKSIVFRKVAVKLLSQNEGFTMERAFPGMIVSTPYQEPVNFASGESAHDEYVYSFLVQIIDSDNHEPEANLKSYWMWQEQVCRLFHGYCPSNVDATHCLMRAASVDVVDEKQWLKDENFVAGVHIAVQVWMTRGAFS